MQLSNTVTVSAPPDEVFALVNDVERVVTGPRAEGWSPMEELLLTATDELHQHRDLSDRTWARLREALDTRTCLELLLLVGHYEMLATTLNTLRVEPDAPRSG